MIELSLFLLFNGLMRIGILCFRSYDAYDFKSELRLKEAAQEQGHDVTLVQTQNFSLGPDGTLLLEGKELGAFDGFISRARVIDQVENRLFWIKVLEEKGYKILNGYEALVQCKNKWFATERLRKAGLPTLPTWVVEDEAIACRTAESIGYPVVVKAPYGTFGLSVEKAENETQLKEVLWRFWKPDFVIPLLMQAFVEEATGTDLRINVVGGQIVGAIQRTAVQGDFRANMELGGSATAYQPSPELAELALQAVQTFGLDFAGVDLIQTKKGPCILEVNGNPGFLRITQITGINVASSIIKLAVSRFQRS